jgi:WD40 repeat protein
MLLDRYSSNPFPGIRPFHTDEYHLFFGREEQTDELLERLQSKHFLVVLGTSGVGKSSLVKAGLLHRIYSGFTVGRNSNWGVVELRPGNSPIENLARQLSKIISNSENPNAFENTKLELNRSSSGLTWLLKYTGYPQKSNLLILIDQFEEIFRFKKNALGEEAANEAAKFVDLLLTAAQKPEVETYIILVMRSDFIGECSQFQNLPEMINESLYLVPRMTRTQLEEAICNPARVAGINMSADLVNLLLSEVENNPNQLPVLQHALMRTWNSYWTEKNHNEELLTIKYYQNIGEVRNALSKHGDEIYQVLSKEQQKMAEIIFKCLTTKEDNKYIRRPTKLKTICAVAEVHEEDLIKDVIENFRKEGCSFLTPDDREELTVDTVIDISHESLIQVWQKLKDWSDEEAEKAEDYYRLVEAWKQHQVNKDNLLSDRRLSVALEWRKKHKPNSAWAKMYAEQSGESIDFDAVMRFLEDSVRQDEKNKEENERQQQQKIRQKNRTIAIISILALFVFIGFITSLLFLKEAKQKELKAFNSAAKAYFTSDRQLQALIEILKASRILKQWYPVIDSEIQLQVLAVLRDMVYSVRERNVITHQDMVTCVSFSKNGQLVASGSDDEKILIWKYNSNEKIDILDNKSAVRSLAFSPNGEILVSGDDNKTIKIWNILHKKLLAEIPNQEKSVTSLDFSPDGKRLVSVAEKTITIWDMTPWTRTGKIIKIFNKKNENKINSVKFLDNKEIVLASNDRTIKILGIDGKEIKSWKNNVQVEDIAFNTKRQLIASASGSEVKLWSRDGKKIGKPLQAHKSIILKLDFSRDGQSIASADNDGRIIVWKSNTSNPMNLGSDDAAFSVSGFDIRGHEAPVYSISFSPNDKILASASADNTVKLWSSDEKEQMLIFDKHSDVVQEVHFSPDGKEFVSASNDNTVRLWSLDGKEHRILGTHTDWVLSAKFSPDGQTIASGSRDKTVKLWDRKGALKKILDKHTDAVRHISFSPDGSILSASSDGQIILWDRDGNFLKTLMEKGSEIIGVSFSLDGQRIVSAHANNTLKIWDRDRQSQNNFIVTREIRVDGEIHGISFGLDGQIIASVEKVIKLWDRDGKHMTDFQPTRDTLQNVSSSLDGKMIVSADTNGFIYIWGYNGDIINVLDGHTGSIFSVAFSPNSQLLASAGRDRTIILWHLSLNGLVDKGCREVKGYLLTHPDIDKESLPCKSES